MVSSQSKRPDHEANNNKATPLCGPSRPWKIKYTDLICCINLADCSWFQQDQQYFSTFNLLKMLYRSSNSLSGFNISVTASIWIWFSCFFCQTHTLQCLIYVLQHSHIAELKLMLLQFTAADWVLRCRSQFRLYKSLCMKTRFSICNSFHF